MGVPNFLLRINGAESIRILENVGSKRPLCAGLLIWHSACTEKMKIYQETMTSFDCSLHGKTTFFSTLLHSGWLHLYFHRDPQQM